jgi:hypothetical protein
MCGRFPQYNKVIGFPQCYYMLLILNTTTKGRYGSECYWTYIQVNLKWKERWPFVWICNLSNVFQYFIMYSSPPWSFSIISLNCVFVAVTPEDKVHLLVTLKYHVTVLNKSVREVCIYIVIYWTFSTLYLLTFQTFLFCSGLYKFLHIALRRQWKLSNTVFFLKPTAMAFYSLSCDCYLIPFPDPFVAVHTKYILHGESFYYISSDVPSRGDISYIRCCKDQ